MIQQEPAFERSEDDAPDASFTKKGSNQNASKNIVQLMDYIIEDITDELANSKKGEEKAQADFEEEKAAAEKLVSDLKDKVVGLENTIAKRIQSKKEENVDKKENNDDRDAELKYQAKIKPDCDWILKAFDQRAEARAAEAAGLTTAKEFLAGRTSLVQKPQKFNDDTLPSLGFLSLAHRGTSKFRCCSSVREAL